MPLKYNVTPQKSSKKLAKRPNRQNDFLSRIRTVAVEKVSYFEYS